MRGNTKNALRNVNDVVEGMSRHPRKHAPDHINEDVPPHYVIEADEFEAWLADLKDVACALLSEV